jgi:hypothetical protein
MSSVVAIMMIAVCNPDLLHCAETETWQTAWEDVEFCREDRKRVTAHYRVITGDGPVIMTRCRLFLNENRHFAEAEVARRMPAENLAMF